jgi:hypothetical protein
MLAIRTDAEAHAQHAFLSRRERGERAGCGHAQVRLNCGVDRLDRCLVLDKIAEARVLLITNGVSSESGCLAIFRILRTFSTEMRLRDWEQDREKADGAARALLVATASRKP